VGSVAYHGPGTAFGRHLHDASLLALLGAVAVADVERATGRPVPRPLTVIVPAVAVGAAHPTTSMFAQLAFGVFAVAGETARAAAVPGRGWPRRRLRAEGVVAAAGALAHVLGRSGGPWCRPDSRVQAHAAWHLAMAASIALRGVGRS
jgi:hypothetical protein